MRKLLMLGLLFFWALPVFAQVDTAWVRTYNGPGNSYDAAYAIAVDRSGNVYVTGESGQSGTWPYNTDYATIKYYPNGDTAWVRRYNGPGNGADMALDIAVDYFGNVYVTGYTEGHGCATIKYKLNGDTAWVRTDLADAGRAMVVDGFGNVYVTGTGFRGGADKDYATIKYYPNGDTAWMRTYNGPGNSWDEAFAIAIDDSSNVYVTGYSYGSGTGSDFATIKYYPNGDTAWASRYNGPGNGDDRAWDIAVDDSGNVYVTGDSPGSGTGYDYATIKYYPNGDTAWVRRYNGPGPGNPNDRASAVAVDGSGNVYVTGYGRGYATIKYSPYGDTAWVRIYGEGYPQSIPFFGPKMAVDGLGNVYVTGNTYGSGSDLDYATVKYYPNGDTAWLRRYNGPGNLDDEAFDMTLDIASNVYVTGQSGSGANPTLLDYATIKYTVFGPPVILRICPQKGANVDNVDITINGGDCREGASVKLVRSGVPADTIKATAVTVYPYSMKIIARFDLAGQPLGFLWDLIVTNPIGGAETLQSAFSIVSPAQLSPEDVLCVLSASHTRIEDLQADVTGSSFLNGDSLGGEVHSYWMYKAPDKSKTLTFPPTDTISATGAIITNGWMYYEIDNQTGEAFETNLLETGDLTPQDYLGANLYDPEAFLNSHYVYIKEYHDFPDSLIFVLQAIPKKSGVYPYSELWFHIDYERGLVPMSITKKQQHFEDTTIITETVNLDNVWVVSKYTNWMTDTSGAKLETRIEYSNIQLNVGIPDSVFYVYPGKIRSMPTEEETTLVETEPILPLKAVSAEWKRALVYKPTPILFLHGIGDESAMSWTYPLGTFWEHFEPYCGYAGWYLGVPDFSEVPGNNSSIDGSNGWAAHLKDFVDSRLNFFVIDSIPEDYRPKKVNIVAHCMGGLAAREYIVHGEDYDTSETWKKVEKLITVGAPHTGSEIADYLRLMGLGEIITWVNVVLSAGTLSVISFATEGIMKICEELLMEEIIDRLQGTDPLGGAVLDMRHSGGFLWDLNSGLQHTGDVKYFAIAGNFSPGNPVIPGPDDYFVSVNRQLGKAGYYWNFFPNLTASSSMRAVHWTWGNEVGEVQACLPQVRRFLHWEQPDVRILSPKSSASDTCDSSALDVCSLKVELRNEYLPATTRLKVTMTSVREGQTLFLLDDYYFKPHPDWAPEGKQNLLRGYFDTTITLAKLPPGKYRIRAEVVDPAGKKDKDSVDNYLGIDLKVEIFGGDPARHYQYKRYSIRYSNEGCSQAEDVQIDAYLPFDNTRHWYIGSLPARQSGEVSTSIYIPGWAPTGYRAIATARIYPTYEDVDPANNFDSEEEQVVSSIDPNVKLAQPQGFAETGYITQGQRLKYTIHFENVDTATADAIDIVVVDTLDPDLNWSTLSIGPTSHPGKCTASFDSVAGIITWTCDSIMLPPDTLPPTGEGFVTYSIYPYYLQHGTEIKNRAAVQFDFNPWFYCPMDSSFVVNTIDEYPPNSRVLPLWDTVSSLYFEVNWKGRDDSLGFGCGIRDYTIYVSDNGGPYEVWIADTSDTFATYHGQLAHTYCFYSVAEDSVGNIEEAPPTPDACTRTPTFIRGDANRDGFINSADVAYLINYLFVSGPAPQPMQAGDANCDGTVNSADVAYLINYLFIGGPPPCR